MKIARAFLTFVVLATSAATINAQTLYYPGGSLGGTTNGNVGIGTASWSPWGAKLAVWYNSAADQVMTLRNTNSAGLSSIRLEDNAGNYVGDIGYYNATGKIRIGGNTSVDAVFEVNNVGIGTQSPGSYGKLAVAGRIAAVSPDNAKVTFWYIENTGAATLAAYCGSGASLGFNVADSSGTPFTSMLINSAGNVGIGTTSPTHKLAVAGTIRAYEVVVDTGWSDYVFDDEYRLAPLDEVEAHIKAKKHLPGIPSAAEVAERGVSIGEMQSKLLAKIEELTLHQIEQEKRIHRLEQENAAMRALILPTQTISTKYP